MKNIYVNICLNSLETKEELLVFTNVSDYWIKQFLVILIMLVTKED